MCQTPNTKVSLQCPVLKVCLFDKWCLHRFLGVGSSNRKNQWQARILYHGKVTHLGYYRTEEEAARVYDKVSISLHGAGAQTNFPIDQVRVRPNLRLG